MDEDKVNISGGDGNAAPPAPLGPKQVVFSWLDWLAVALGVGLAVLWFQAFSLERLLRVPGAGTTAFVLAALLAEAAYLRFRICLRRDALFLTGCTVLLAVSCSLFGNYAVRMINLALLAFLTPAAALAMAGRDFPSLTYLLIPETFRLFIPNLFVHFIKPFQALRHRGHSYKSLWIVLAALVVMLPLFAVVLSLLSSADAVFGGMLGSVADWMSDIFSHLSSVWDVARTAIWGLMLFSFLYSLRLPAKPRIDTHSAFRGFACLPFIAVLALLDVIYAVFAGVQFIYLFGGAEAAAMHGGFAEYARSGFYQLVAVAGINLAAGLISLKTDGRGKSAVRALIYALVGLTFVILASALYRMLLYISAYGMSVRRALTLFAMSYIAVCLAALAVKTAKPDFKIFPVFVSVFLIFWLIFCFVNIDARIAEYNVDAYLEGRTDEIDVYYLTDDLSMSARPALERLFEAEPSLRDEAAENDGSGIRDYSWANWYLFG